MGECNVTAGPDGVGDGEGRGQTPTDATLSDDNTAESVPAVGGSGAAGRSATPTLPESPYAEWKHLLRDYFHVDRAWRMLAEVYSLFSF